jgi:hypothetical protein
MIITTNLKRKTDHELIVIAVTNIKTSLNLVMIVDIKTETSLNLVMINVSKTEIGLNPTVLITVDRHQIDKADEIHLIPTKDMTPRIVDQVQIAKVTVKVPRDTRANCVIAKGTMQ